MPNSGKSAFGLGYLPKYGAEETQEVKTCGMSSIKMFLPAPHLMNSPQSTALESPEHHCVGPSGPWHHRSQLTAALTLLAQESWLRSRAHSHPPKWYSTACRGHSGAQSDDLMYRACARKGPQFCWACLGFLRGKTDMCLFVSCDSVTSTAHSAH